MGVQHPLGTLTIGHPPATLTLPPGLRLSLRNDNHQKVHKLSFGSHPALKLFCCKSLRTRLLSAAHRPDGSWFQWGHISNECVLGCVSSMTTHIRFDMMSCSLSLSALCALHSRDPLLLAV